MSVQWEAPQMSPVKPQIEILWTTSWLASETNRFVLDFGSIAFLSLVTFHISFSTVSYSPRIANSSVNVLNALDLLIHSVFIITFRLVSSFCRRVYWGLENWRICSKSDSCKGAEWPTEYEFRKFIFINVNLSLFQR